MAGKRNRIIDQAVVKAVDHPVRVEVLDLLAPAAELSPEQIADKLGRKLGNVSYHVKVLLDGGVVELVRTEQRGGGVEHFFRPVAEMRDTVEAAKAMVDGARS
jgi:DNA-binding transcriptional ArsR family regulator